MPHLLLTLLVMLISTALTLAGGRLARYAHLTSRRAQVVAASAGAVLAVVFADLLPEAMRAGIPPNHLCLLVAAGFFAFYTIERLAHFHSCRRLHLTVDTANLGTRLAGIGVLSLHSLLDGVLVGVSLAAGAHVGLVVLLGVLGHRFVDGVNVESVEFCAHGCAHEGGARSLWLNAAAMCVGMIIAQILVIPSMWLAPTLAVSAGFLLYLGASDLLPLSSREDGSFPTLVSVASGFTAICALVAISG